jgi:glutamine synthetase
MREVGGKEYFEALMAAFDKYKNEHIAVYGPDNHLRLTGLHETQSIDKFNYGVANRGASIRVPHSFVNNGYKGYLEDRRPNSQGDPYKIASRILQTIATVPLLPSRRAKSEPEESSIYGRRGLLPAPFAVREVEADVRTGVRPVFKFLPLQAVLNI